MLAVAVLSKLLNVVRRPGPPADAEPPPPPPPPKRPPLPAALLARMIGLDPTRGPRLGERRRRPRLDFACPVIIDAETEPQPRTCAAQVCDISAEGIAIELDEPLAPGTRFSLTLPLLDEGEGIVTLRYVVRRCASPASGDRYHVGGELFEYVD